MCVGLGGGGGRGEEDGSGSVAREEGNAVVDFMVPKSSQSIRSFFVIIDGKYVHQSRLCMYMYERMHTDNARIYCVIFLIFFYQGVFACMAAPYADQALIRP